jgi:hypothetical protein
VARNLKTGGAEGNFMSNIAEKRRKDHSFSGILRTHALDVARVRRYLAGVEALAREAQDTRDPRVLLDALSVLSLQPANVRDLLTQEVCRVR